MANTILQLSKDDLREVFLEMLNEASFTRREPETVTATSTEKTPRLYTRQEVCELLGITPPTFHRLANSGAFSVIKVGRHTRVDADELDAKVAAGIVGRYRRNVR